MKKTFLIALCFLFTQAVWSQNVLILENLTVGKSYKFYTGDKIILKTANGSGNISGKITDILDSSIVVSNYYVFNLHEISVIYKERLGVEIISTSLMAFGGLFFGLDVVNNIINDDHPTVRTDVALISTGVAACGGVLQIFAKRKCVIGKNQWRLKIIDQVHVKSQR